MRKLPHLCHIPALLPPQRKPSVLRRGKLPYRGPLHQRSDQMARLDTTPPPAQPQQTAQPSAASATPAKPTTPPLIRDYASL